MAPSSVILQPFQLLELNLISAQDLQKVSRSMKTYAVAWVHPDRKLSTRIDSKGRMNPTWNDKFVFRVDEEFLQKDTAAVMVEIFASHWFRDIHVGTVRVLVGNLLPPPPKPHQREREGQMQLGMKFVAVQVRRPTSGRPQGILNIGVALLDSSMRSMPLNTQLSSALGYQHLMGEQELVKNRTSHATSTSTVRKPLLRRTMSDSSSLVAIPERRRGGGGGSMVHTNKNKKTYSKSSSSVSGGSGYFKKKNGSEVGGKKVKTKKSRSLLSGFGVGHDEDQKNELKKGSKVLYEYGAANQYIKYNKKGRPLMTESELGPSPSEVAAAIARDRFLKKADAASSIVLPVWNDDDDLSVEGLHSKLERWRAELPDGYDSSYVSSVGDSSLFQSTVALGGKHNRRHTESEAGLFSCFSNICGCECTIVIGNGDNKKNKKGAGRLIRSNSFDEESYA